jgi:hypothetical protein
MPWIAPFFVIGKEVRSVAPVPMVTMSPILNLLLVLRGEVDGASGLGGAAGGVEDADYGDVGVERIEVVLWL